MNQDISRSMEKKQKSHRTIQFPFIFESLKEKTMSQFRVYESKDDTRSVTFQDKKIIKDLLESDKLTEDEREALDHLYYSYNYATD